jgi:hypothetical protein
MHSCLKTKSTPFQFSLSSYQLQFFLQTSYTTNLGKFKLKCRILTGVEDYTVVQDPLGVRFKRLSAPICILLDVFLQHCQCHRLDYVTSVFGKLFFIDGMNERFRLHKKKLHKLNLNMLCTNQSTYPTALDHSLDCKLEQTAEVFQRHPFHRLGTATINR